MSSIKDFSFEPKFDFKCLFYYFVMNEEYEEEIHFRSKNTHSN
jgi:hypothetical protein